MDLKNKNITLIQKKLNYKGKMNKQEASQKNLTSDKNRRLSSSLTKGSLYSVFFKLQHSLPNLKKYYIQKQYY